MTNALDVRTLSGERVCDIVLEPLSRYGVAPLVVDAGARSGMLELPRSYARVAELIGFEPNPIEHRKLVTDDTDPIRAGYEPPRFATERYLDVALWDSEGASRLVITNGPGTATLMGEADPKTTGNVYRSGEDVPFYDIALKTIGEESVKTQRLDAIIDADRAIDYLKVDVEGGEMRVLSGARSLLDDHRILVVRSEFVALTYYDDHPILGDQHRALHNAGFRLIDLDPSPARYSRGPTKIPVDRDRRLLQSGDAVYILDPDRIELPQLHLQRMALVALALGFASLGVGLLRDADMSHRSRVDDVETALARVPLDQRLSKSWQGAPDKARRAVATIRRMASKAKSRSARA